VTQQPTLIPFLIWLSEPTFISHPQRPRQHTYSITENRTNEVEKQLILTSPLYAHFAPIPDDNNTHTPLAQANADIAPTLNIPPNPSNPWTTLATMKSTMVFAGLLASLAVAQPHGHGHGHMHRRKEHDHHNKRGLVVEWVTETKYETVTAIVDDSTTQLIMPSTKADPTTSQPPATPSPSPGQFFEDPKSSSSAAPPPPAVQTPPAVESPPYVGPDAIRVPISDLFTDTACA